MSTAGATMRITPEEYLRRERAAPFRSEYCNGFVTAMAGASRPHNLIACNLASEVNISFRGRPCEVYQNDMRVCVEETGLYTYPDVVAVCGERHFLDDHSETLLNPTVLVEVLSPSTEAYDRGAKSAHYRRLPSLREYVLIDQDRVSVERYTRQEDHWRLTEFNSLDDTLTLESIAIAVPLRVIYDKVFPAPAGQPAPETGT